MSFLKTLLFYAVEVSIIIIVAIVIIGTFITLLVLFRQGDQGNWQLVA